MLLSAGCNASHQLCVWLNLCCSASQTCRGGLLMALKDQQTRKNSDAAPAGRGQPASAGPGGPKGTLQAKMPPSKTWLWFVGALLANYLLMRFLFPVAEAPTTVPYTL